MGSPERQRYACQTQRYYLPFRCRDNAWVNLGSFASGVLSCALRGLAYLGPGNNFDKRCDAVSHPNLNLTYIVACSQDDTGSAAAWLVASEIADALSNRLPTQAVGETVPVCSPAWKQMETSIDPACSAICQLVFAFPAFQLRVTKAQCLGKNMSVWVLQAFDILTFANPF